MVRLFHFVDDQINLGVELDDSEVIPEWGGGDDVAEELDSVAAFPIDLASDGRGGRG